MRADEVTAVTPERARYSLDQLAMDERYVEETVNASHARVRSALEQWESDRKELERLRQALEWAEPAALEHHKTRLAESEWRKEIDALKATQRELVEALRDLVRLNAGGWHGANPKTLDAQWFTAGLNKAKAALSKAGTP